MYLLMKVLGIISDVFCKKKKKNSNLNLMSGSQPLIDLVLQRTSVNVWRHF